MYCPSFGGATGEDDAEAEWPFPTALGDVAPKRERARASSFAAPSRIGASAAAASSKSVWFIRR